LKNNARTATYYSNILLQQQKQQHANRALIYSIYSFPTIERITKLTTN